MSSMPPPLPPGAFRERLLPTDASSVDRGDTDAISRFCASQSQVDAAYVCLTERQREGEEPVTALKLSFKLHAVVEDPSDSRAPARELLERLVGAEPELARRLGCGVLADRAVPAWERHGVTVFVR